MSKVVAICSDSAGKYSFKRIVTPYLLRSNLYKSLPANCKLFREIVEAMHPHVRSFPCVVHIMNLLTADLSKIISFESTLGKAMKIVNAFAWSPKLPAILEEAARVLNTKVTQIPSYSPTRFSSSFKCLEALSTNRHLLENLVRDPSYNLEKLVRLDVRKLLDDSQVFADFKRLELFLEPICTFIHQMEASDTKLASCYEGLIRTR